MQLLKVYYAYFSPGNTTEKVLSQIASSFENYPVESINLTSYDERQQEHHFKENELLIIGVPAYGGRVPVPVVDAFNIRCLRRAWLPLARRDRKEEHVWQRTPF